MGTLQNDTIRLTQQKQLKDFQHNAKMVLALPDRDYLFAIMKEYQRNQELDKFMVCLRSVMDTPAKLDLLKDIRNFVPRDQLVAFDQLAPYHKMAHPWRMMKGQGSRPPKSPQRIVGQPHTVPTLEMSQKLGHRVVVNGLMDVEELSGPVQAVTITKQPGQGLGFSIRGGSEHGLGVFVSDVEEDSAADEAGLEVGDLIVEVNSVSFENIASSSAVKVLMGASRLRIMVRKIGKIPVFRSAKEKTSWYDVCQSLIVEGNMEEHGTFHRPTGLGYQDIVQRRINISSRSRENLGFNIRGGSEYGLGVYVSRVDPRSVAEIKGLQVGDQILDVNGIDFQSITHTRSVEVLKAQPHLVLTVMDTGKYPAFKEIYAEYSWVDVPRNKERKKKMPPRNPAISPLPLRQLTDVKHEMFTQFPMETNLSSYHSDDSEGSRDIDDIVDNIDGDDVHQRLNGNDDDDDEDNDDDEDSDEVNDGGSDEDDEDEGPLQLDSDLMERFESPSGINSPTEMISDLSSEADDISDGTQESVNIPTVSDLVLQGRPLDDLELSHKRKYIEKKIKNKSTLAVKAMELETRRQHPELARQMDQMKYGGLKSSDESVDVDNHRSKKSKPLMGFFLGASPKKPAPETSASRQEGEGAVMSISNEPATRRQANKKASQPRASEQFLREHQDQHAKMVAKRDSRTRRSLESIESLTQDTRKLVRDRDVKDVYVPASPDSNTRVEIIHGKGVTKVFKSLQDGGSYSDGGSSASSSPVHQVYSTGRESDMKGKNLEGAPSKTNEVQVHRMSNGVLPNRGVKLLQDDPYSMELTHFRQPKPSDKSQSNPDSVRTTSKSASASVDFHHNPEISRPSELNRSQSRLGNGDDMARSNDSTDSSETREGSYNVNLSARSSDSEKSLHFTFPPQMITDAEDSDSVEIKSFSKRAKTPPVFEPPPPPSASPPLSLYHPPSSEYSHLNNVSYSSQSNDFIGTGSLRDMYKKRNTAKQRPNVTQMRFVETPKDSTETPQPVSKQQDRAEEYLQMTHDLIQDFLQHSNDPVIKDKNVASKKLTEGTSKVEESRKSSYPLHMKSALDSEVDHRRHVVDSTLNSAETDQPNASGSRITVPEKRGHFMVQLDKRYKMLGLSVSGGVSSQPEIRVYEVRPGGAAHIEGSLKPGMKLLSIDGLSLVGTSHKVAVEAIRSGFTNQQTKYLQIEATSLE